MGPCFIYINAENVILFPSVQTNVCNIDCGVNSQVNEAYIVFHTILTSNPPLRMSATLLWPLLSATSKGVL